MRGAVKASLALMTLALALSGCDALTTPQHRLARARAELDAGQWGRAAIDLRKLVQRDPHNAEAWLLLAHLSVDMGAANAAQADLNHAAAAGAQGLELDVLRARTLLALGQSQALIDALSHHQLASIAEPERTVELARAYLSLGQQQQAVPLLTSVLEAHPDDVEARLTLAHGLALDGKLDQALAQVDRVLVSDPHLAQAILQRANLLDRLGQLPAAENAFRLALQNMSGRALPGERATALMGLTQTRLDQGKIELATQSQAVLVKLAAGAPNTRLLGARLKLAHNDLRGAIADLQALVARAPKFTRAQLLLGTAELQQGNLEQAQQAFEQVVQQDPDNVEAREALAKVQLLLHRPKQALQTLTPALSEQYADRQMQSLLGAVMTRSGAPNDVLQSLEHEVQAHPQDRALRLNLAQAYLNAGRAREAMPLIQGTPELANDRRREGLYIEAVSLLNGPGAAGVEVEKLLTTHPHDGRILDVAATYYAIQGQLGRARALLQQALELDKQNPATLAALAQVESAGGDLPSAESSLRGALALAPASKSIRLALANVLMARKAYDEADIVLAPLGGPRADPQVQFELARLALVRGDLKQGNAALDLAVAQQPTSAELEDQSGDVLMQANQYQSALARYTKATQLVPNGAISWFSAGRAQLALHESSAARASFEKAAELQPGWLPPIGGLVLIDLEAKDYQGARNRVARLLASRPADTGVLALQGDVEWAAGNLKAGEAAYLQAQQRQASAGVAVKLFRMRLTAHQPKPEQPLTQWLELRPDDRTVRTVLGSYYLSQRALHQAAAEFETILQLVPTDAVALNDLAWIYGEQHDPRAEALAERAYQLAPDQPNVDDTFGWILARAGKVDRALPLLQQAAKLDTGDPNVQYHYAYALAQQGRRAEAQQVLSNLLSTQHDFDSRRDAERLLADTRT